MLLVGNDAAVAGLLSGPREAAASKPKRRPTSIRKIERDPAMTKTIHGKIQGQAIVFDEPLGLPPGQEVEVTITPITHERPWGEGIRRSAGALADSWTEEDDRILAGIQEDRKRTTSREMFE
jgi:hypothetical protein